MWSNVLHFACEVGTLLHELNCFTHVMQLNGLSVGLKRSHYLFVERFIIHLRGGSIISRRLIFWIQRRNTSRIRGYLLILWFLFRRRRCFWRFFASRYRTFLARFVVLFRYDITSFRLARNLSSIGIFFDIVGGALRICSFNYWCSFYNCFSRRRRGPCLFNNRGA